MGAGGAMSRLLIFYFSFKDCFFPQPPLFFPPSMASICLCLVSTRHFRSRLCAAKMARICKQRKWSQQFFLGGRGFIMRRCSIGVHFIDNWNSFFKQRMPHLLGSDLMFAIKCDRAKASGSNLFQNVEPKSTGELLKLTEKWASNLWV